MSSSVLHLEPIPSLLRRIKSTGPLRLSRAPGRLDVMGGIADYTGSMVCQYPLDRAAAVALRKRDDREIHIRSFNLEDEKSPSTFQISLAVLAESSVDELRNEFKIPARKWAGYLAGCLKILHEHEWIDLQSASVTGLELSLWSTVPLGAGVSSSAAIEVATMINLCDHFALRDRKIGPMELAAMCQEVEHRIVGAPCGIMDQVASCSGQADSLLRLLCQPHELQPPLALPAGIRVVGIDSRVRHSVAGGQYGKTRCAAFMGHRIILQKMRDMGLAAGKTLEADPMRGYLANLAPDDYKRFFRPHLPEQMTGRDFLAQYGSTIDAATAVDEAVAYHVQSATDHHVLEARRVRNFIACLESADSAPSREKELNKAGHLMYASHISYTRDALLGAEECDLLVDLVRQREAMGLYGAKITGGGGGGTVAVLCQRGEKSDAAIVQIIDEYRKQTGNQAVAFAGSSPGAWQAGTVKTD
ncbi:MAG TPA: hypothetical protein VL992_17915 [Tepidisphaeraceae bacterium]|nr:hypothetical protein [Tepidisphaeraceae bacterium]